MPVLPRVTVSEAENFDGRGLVARAASRSFELSQAAPSPEAERMRNSRRCIKPPRKRNSLIILRVGTHSKCFRNAAERLFDARDSSPHFQHLTFCLNFGSAQSRSGFDA